MSYIIPFIYFWFYFIRLSVPQAIQHLALGLLFTDNLENM